MEAMRQSWTDDRLDDLNSKVDRLDDHMRAEFTAVRSEMREGFAAVDRRFEGIDRRFEQIDRRFEQIDGRFEQIDGRFERSDERMAAGFARLDADIKALHRLLLRASIGAVSALVVAVSAAALAQL